jgi:hypothetical protein
MSQSSVYMVKIASVTVYIYWEPHSASTLKQPHVIYPVLGALEVVCRHKELDIDHIEKHVKAYLRG